MASGGRPALGRRVAVYGGGNTAMSAARTAWARTTGCIAPAPRAQMPAHEDEATDANCEVPADQLAAHHHRVTGAEMTIEVMELDETRFPYPTG